MSRHIATRVVGDNWTYFWKYAFLRVQWTVFCDPSRRCRVGVGVWLGGEPRGEKKDFSGRAVIDTMGVGTIHIKAIDGQGPCAAALYMGDWQGIPIINTPFSTPDDEQGVQLDTTQVAAVTKYNEAVEELLRSFPADANPFDLDMSVFERD